MFKKLFDNIYSRNLIVLGLIITVQYALDVTNTSKDKKPYNLVMNLTFITLMYIYVLIHNKILFEKFLNLKKYLFYILLFALLLFCDYFISIGLIKLITDEKIQYSYTFGRTVFIYLGFAVYIAYKYFNQQSKLRELEALKRENELNQLKAQLNPHFLYNALNNIYSYLLINNDGTGKELILKLSELMRYLTDDSQRESVTLEESVKFIQNYIAFEKERLGKRCTINFILDIQESQLTIAPHIIFPLIENAFKHGTNSISPVTIDIKMQTEGKIFKLEITNDVYPVQNKKTSHTGIQNVKRRLEILYPGKFRFNITNDELKYVIDLKIDLS